MAKLIIIPSPEHRRLGSCPPELRYLGEGASQLALHMAIQSGRTPRQHLEDLTLKRHREEWQYGKS